jgi:hypothetical protein
MIGKMFQLFYDGAGTKRTLSRVAFLEQMHCKIGRCTGILPTTSGSSMDSSAPDSVLGCTYIVVSGRPEH